MEIVENCEEYPNSEEEALRKLSIIIKISVAEIKKFLVSDDKLIRFIPIYRSKEFFFLNSYVTLE
jgi:hypothetical protein